MIGEMEPPSCPIVRFYTWNRATISYGLNQNPLKRLRIEKCLRDGIEIVARPTGGREILHGWDLCCSVIRPIDERRSGVDFKDLFGRTNEVFRQGLNRLGITSEHHSVSRKCGFRNGPCFRQIDRGEISVSGRKIIASAQRIYDRTVLQQSSISIEKPDYDIMDYLQIGKETELKGETVNSVAYLEEYVRETFSMSGIVEVFRYAFEMEMGKAGKLNLPGIF